MNHPQFCAWDKRQRTEPFWNVAPPFPSQRQNEYMYTALSTIRDKTTQSIERDRGRENALCKDEVIHSTIFLKRPRHRPWDFPEVKDDRR